MTLVEKYFIIKGVISMSIREEIIECVAELEALTALIKHYKLLDIK